ncbi:MAG TPA: TonB-dependent receptor [Pedomonas sp.]|uniref:TonB-dependent receptor n=1 Tax=Pedomonas sp. TaxID=2976421 RepID=UPI002F41ED20
MKSVLVARGGRTRFVSFLGASVVALASTQAFAQNAAPAADEAYSLGEIIVTAQRREQNLQEVPIAISAVGEKFLERRNITSLDQLGSFAPNVKIERGSSNATVTQISIRGATTLNPAMTWEPAVGLYLDGVYLGKAQGGFFDVADIERVEVLRGPQGTLYGRNTLAGAVNIITAKPTGELGGKAQVSVGNYDYGQVRGSLNLPAFGDFAVKLSGQITKRDGIYDMDPSFGGPDETDDLNSKSGLVQVRWTPSDALTVDYSYDYSKINQNTAYTQPYGYSEGSIFDPSSPFYSGLPYADFVNKDWQKEGAYNSNAFEKSRIYGHNLTIAYDAGSIGEVKTITAWRHLTFDDTLDLDGSPLALAQSSRDSTYRFFSQEIQLAGSAGNFDYLVGAFYSADRAAVLNPQTFFYGASTYDSRYSGRTKSYAAFSQIDWHATDALTVTAGLRYTHEKKTISRYYIDHANPANSFGHNIDDIRGKILPGELTPGQTFTGPDAKYNNVSPTLVVNYKLDEEINAYAKYAKGFKSGGFNGEAADPRELQNPYGAEKVDAYEVGIKSRLFDNRLSLNVAGFWNESKDMQMSVFTATGGTASYVLNAGKARVRGIEVEMTGQLADGLTLVGSLAYMNTKYKEFIDGGVDVADNRAFIHSPKWQGNLSLDWRAAEFSNGSQLNLIGDLNYTAKYFIYPYALVGTTASGQNAYNTQAPERTIVDLRAVWGNLPMGNATGSISVFAKNIFDVNKPLNFIDFGANFGGLTTANFIQPRTYGVTFGINF